MIDERFVIGGAILNAIGSATYVLSTIKGQTKPNRVSWFLWAVAPLIACAAQLDDGVGWPLLMTFMVGFGPLMIFIASFLNRQAYWKLTTLDIWCGAIAAAALAVWAMTGQGVLAVVLSIAADLLAGIPTLVKAYRQPETEHPAVFRNAALSALITLLTVKTWTFIHYGFALYIFLFCVLFYVLIRFRIGVRIAARSQAQQIS